MKLVPVGGDRLDEILEVYRQCEDFLALGPVAKASVEMVVADLELSQRAGGSFFGIFTDEGSLAGVMDCVFSHYAGDPGVAYIELLMIAQPYRHLGLGQAVMAEIEQRIWSNPEIMEIDLGVQVNNPLGKKFWESQGFRVTSGPQEQSDGTITYAMYKKRKP